MAEGAPPELAGKGKRVGGVFVFMIGASILLDTHALWIGLPILAIGAALLAWGMAEAREPEPLAAPARDARPETRP